jgi:hypothetical protein
LKKLFFLCAFVFFCASGIAATEHSGGFGGGISLDRDLNFGIFGLIDYMHLWDDGRFQMAVAGSMELGVNLEYVFVSVLGKLPLKIGPCFLFFQFGTEFRFGITDSAESFFTTFNAGVGLDVMISDDKYIRLDIADHVRTRDMDKANQDPAFTNMIVKIAFGHRMWL